MNSQVKLLFDGKELSMANDFVQNFSHFGLREVRDNVYEFEKKEFESVIKLLLVKQGLI